MRSTKFDFRNAALGLLLAGAGVGQAGAASLSVTADIAVSETWRADNEYVLTKPIYVTSGATLTIEAGTVVRGEPESFPGANDPGTLIITRGSKIQALGTPDKPIVFTDLLDDNVRHNPGTTPYGTFADAIGITGQWGGVILLGRGYVSNNTAGGPLASREVQIEGLTAAGGLGFYGNGGDDDDDSGAIRYASIRYGGFNLSPNNEINGLTLGAVGRETDVSFVEVFQNKDDGVELFGGAVNLRNVVVANVGDDSIDYDEGWRGKAQFVFAMQGTPGADKSDKGGEHDGGNSPDGSQPFATPAFYNVTYIGLGEAKAYTDRSKNTVLHFRDNAGGRYYNSFFGDFGGAEVLIEGGSLPGGSSTAANTSGERSITAYTLDGAFFLGPASTFQLELEDNCFWCIGRQEDLGVPLTLPTGDATAYGGDAGKNHHDNGLFTSAALDNTYATCASGLPIRELVRASSGDPATPDPIVSIDPRPAAGSALLGTDRTPPSDGFFTAAPYKGAFAPDQNWAAGWTTTARLDVIPGCEMGVGPEANEVRDLIVGGSGPIDTERITWTAPLGANGTEMYDVLRSGDPSDFLSALCLETDDGSDRSAVDPDVPALGGIYHYLVRAQNGCGGPGVDGTLGTDSAGVQRIGVGCP
jgi:hypothetical protein